MEHKILLECNHDPGVGVCSYKSENWGGIVPRKWLMLNHERLAISLEDESDLH